MRSDDTSKTLTIVKNDNLAAAAGNSPAERIDPAAVCELCYGTGIQVLSGKGTRVCECHRKDRQLNLRDAAHIPRRYANCTLENFRAANDSQYVALEYAKNLVRDYPQIDRGFLFMGPVG